jgi:hypothetical protein
MSQINEESFYTGRKLAVPVAKKGPLLSANFGFFVA